MLAFDQDILQISRTVVYLDLPLRDYISRTAGPSCMPHPCLAHHTSNTNTAFVQTKA
jgi:hypothetical protein